MTPIGRGADEIAAYLAAGYWGTESLTDHVRHWRAVQPTGLAFAGEDARITWAEYDELSTELALALMDAGLQPGDRLAVLLPDGPDVHVAWLAAEKAGLVAVGIGARAGQREALHLLRKSRCRAVLSGPDQGDRSPDRLVAELHADGAPVVHLAMGSLAASGSWKPAGLTGDQPGVQAHGPGDVERRRLAPSDLFFLNSTSGTTGLPKCVMHTQNRWMYFHQLAVEAGGLTSADVFCSAIPSPFGFGLWTAHFTPTLLGAPTHVRRRFQPASLLELLAEAKVTVLAAVTTQLIMLLNSPALADADLTALRVVFAGGEAVPYERAAAFEERTGAQVLQFYGSNETGAVSRTTIFDDRSRRLTTAGKVIDAMQVRLVDPADHQPVTGGPGQPACRGPATCEGYYDDPDANAALYTEDGWMLMGDLVEIDDGFLTVIGRTSDIIIRGGKNISAAAVEAEVMTHPAVAMAAAVAVPDPVFGERVCVYVQPRPGHTVVLGDLTVHLEHRGVSREWFPEHLIVVDDLPRSSGGKVAKGALREDVRQRLELTHEGPEGGRST